MAQEVDDFGDLSLGALVAGDVGEAGGGLLLVVDLGLGSTDAHDPPGQLLGISPPDPDEEGDEEQQGKEGEQIGQERRARSDAGDVDVMGLQRRRQLVVVDGRRDLARVVVAPLERARDGAAGVDRRGADVARGDLGQELRIGEALGGRARHVRNEEQEQRDEDPNGEEPHPPPRWRRARRCWWSIVGLARLGCPGEVTDRVRH